MRNILPIVTVFVLVAACSQQTDFEGQWNNNDSATLALHDDSVAVMGQDGIEGAVEGKYWVKSDTIWIQSAVEEEFGDDIFNTFTFVYRNDSLHLVEIALHRGGDIQTLKGSDFAQRLGKRPEDMAFTRSQGAE